MSIKSYINICNFYVHDTDHFIIRLYDVTRGGNLETLVKILGLKKSLLTSAPILYPLERTENFCFSRFLRGYKMGTLARNGLIQPCQKLTLLLDRTHHSFYEHEKSLFIKLETALY